MEMIKIYEEELGRKINPDCYWEFIRELPNFWVTRDLLPYRDVENLMDYYKSRDDSVLNEKSRIYLKKLMKFYNYK